MYNIHFKFGNLFTYFLECVEFIFTIKIPTSLEKGNNCSLLIFICDTKYRLEISWTSMNLTWKIHIEEVYKKIAALAYTLYEQTCCCHCFHKIIWFDFPLELFVTAISSLRRYCPLPLSLPLPLSSDSDDNPL